MTDLPSERARLLRLTLAPAALIAVLGGAALAVQDLAVQDLAAAPAATDTTTNRTGLIAAGAFALLAITVLVLAARRARRAEREQRRREEAREALVRDWVAHYSAAVAAARGDLRDMLQQVLHGQRPDQPAAPAPVTPGDAFAALDQELRLLHHESAMAVLHASAHQQVEVFVNIARRLQSLVTRSLQELDALEGEVEDPELLGGLLRVDHLGTRLRRHVESLAVLGGATPRRIGRPVAVYTVLRQALSEIEQYARVKILRPVEGTLKGHVVTDVIHLVAELIENATNFSRPETQVHVRAQLVAAGLAIEIDDRGLGIPLEERERLERLLTRPDLVDLGEQLKDGRIGLFVVARLAQRHGIAVRPQSNIYGGTQAVVVIPHALLELEPVPAPAAATPRQAPAQATELPPQHAPVPSGAGRSAAGTWRGDESGLADARGWQQPARHEAARSGDAATGLVPGGGWPGHDAWSAPEPQPAQGAWSAPEPQPAQGAWSAAPAHDGPVPAPQPAPEGQAGGGGWDAGSAREALPVRRRGEAAAQSWGAPAVGDGGGFGAGAAGEHGGSDAAPVTGDRPPLPRRTGSYLVPELRDRISPPDSAHPGPTPDLMARFALGQQRAEHPDQ